MRASRLTWGSLPIGLLLILGTACGPGLDERLPAGAARRLTIDLPAGDVTVSAHDADEVHIRVDVCGLNSPALSLALTHEGDQIALRADLSPLRIRLFDALDVQVRAVVPRSFDVEVDTDSGSVKAGDIRGALDVETRQGTISVAGTTGPIEASTRSGGIHIEDAGGPVEAESRNGEIFASFSGAPSGRIETRYGTIEVRFDEQAGVDLEARSKRGHVRIDERFRTRRRLARRIATRLNGGGPPLQLASAHSDIRVEPSLVLGIARFCALDPALTGSRSCRVGRH